MVIAAFDFDQAIQFIHVFINIDPGALVPLRLYGTGYCDRSQSASSHYKQAVETIFTTGDGDFIDWHLAKSVDVNTAS